MRIGGQKMNTKKIFTLAVSIAVLGGASIFTFANQNSDAGTKNVVVTENNAQANKSNTASTNGIISDEKATQIATKAMKDYMGLDASYFSRTTIHRAENQYDEKMKMQSEIEKHQDNTVIVWFERADHNTDCSNFVEIDEKTGKITNVTAINDLDPNSYGKINDAKVKEVAIDYMKKMGKDKEVDLDSIVVSNTNGALSGVDFNLKNANESKEYKFDSKIGLEVSLQNYTVRVMHYQNYPNTHNK
jgi:uncharacterized protein YxeA